VVAMLWLFDTWEGTFGGHNIFQKTHTHVSMTVCKGRVPVEQVSDRSIRSQNTGRNSVENWECYEHNEVLVLENLHLGS
jgi:hypothetical protein